MRASACLTRIVHLDAGTTWVYSRDPAVPRGRVTFTDRGPVAQCPLCEAYVRLQEYRKADGYTGIEYQLHYLEHLNLKEPA